MDKFITYYRVSTKEQGSSGLGLEAQQAKVNSFLDSKGVKPLETFTEIESGGNGDRPILEEAIQTCEESGATLLIANLDRLTRDVEFGFQLKRRFEKAKIRFRALDLPAIHDTVTFGVHLTMKQYEREEISRRTKEALQAAKERGVKLGSPENLTDEAREKAWATISRKAREDEDTRKAFHFIQPRRDQGKSYQTIADELNKEGYRTRTGKKFHPAQVRKIYLRFTD